MKLSVIIVSYNVKDYLAQCLVALQRALRDIEADVYVVDNHSKDDSVHFVTTHFPNVHLVSCSHNYGFAHANNIAIRQSDSEYLLLLNPDTVVGESVISRALSFMDSHDRCSAVGVQMLKADGSKAKESRRGLPSPMTAFYKMSGLCERFPQSRRFAKYYMSYLPLDQPARIDVVSGAFCLLRHSALDQVGLLDEDFFMYGEDIDLSYRLLRGGYENWYLPLKILHYKGESTQKSSFRYVHVFYEAMFVFFRKHYSHMFFLLSVPIKMAIYLKAGVALVSMLCTKVRHGLGFFRVHREAEPEYVFIGSAKSIGQCRLLARNKGLKATFIIGNNDTLSEGHIGRVSPIVNQYVVYDISSFTYDRILSFFSRKPMPHVNIGLFYPDQNTIITAEDILR